MPTDASLYAGAEILGIVRGASGVDVALEAVSPALEGEVPQRGDFLLLEESADAALVARVIGARPGGPFAHGKEVGASYLSELTRTGPGAVPEEIRRMLYRLHLDLRILGQLERKAGELSFEAGSRQLDPFGFKVRRPSPESLLYLASAGQKEGSGVVKFGVLSRGSQRLDDVPVFFSIDRLKGKRSFVFARAGYGKSNLVKYLLSRLYDAPPDVGLLIFDPEGEYATRQKTSPGLADHPRIRERLRIFTDRKDVAAAYGDVVVPSLRLDFGELDIEAVLEAFVPKEKWEQVWSNQLRGMLRRSRDGGDGIAFQDPWKELVRLLHRDGFLADDGAIRKLVTGQSDEHDGARKNVSLAAIKNNLVPAIQRLHDPRSELVSQVSEDLQQGRVVVIDTSLAPSSDARAIGSLLLGRLFRERVEALTGGKHRLPVLAVFEEAQTILSRGQDDDGSIFVRWVKEGRKYGLGALLITQQPGAIPEEILSQGDNFFVMHLLAEADLLALRRSNAHFSPEILDFIRTEPVKGNCYFWSAPDQPYVVPCRVENYDETVRLAAPAAAVRAPKPVAVRPAAVAVLAEELLRILAEDRRVYLVPVATLDGAPAAGLLAVSPEYLAGRLPNRAPGATDRPTEFRVEELLRGLGVLARSGRRAGKVEGWTTDSWLVLDGAKLEAACANRAIEVKAFSDRRIDLAIPVS